MRILFIGKKDDELGEKLILIVEGEKREIDPAVYGDLDKYEKPKEVYFVAKSGRCFVRQYHLC